MTCNSYNIFNPAILSSEKITPLYKSFSLIAIDLYLLFKDDRSTLVFSPKLPAFAYIQL
jgi:hypothetical protein